MSYTVEFPTQSSAHDFLESARASPMSWKDPQSSLNVPLRARPDRSLSVRLVMRAMGALWSQVEEAITSSGRMRQDVKIATTGHKGTLFVTDGKDVWVLFSTKTHGPASDENCQISFVAENCCHWGIAEAEATAMIDAARAKIAKRE